MFKETMIFICIKLSESFLWKKLTSAYFKHFVYVPTKYDAARHKKKPRIGLSLPILFIPAFSVEKQYQMTHSTDIHI